MRKQDMVIIWPAYFDSNKTRKRGRRVPKNLGVQAPKIAELEAAAQKLGVNFELVPDKGYPKTPWYKPGMLLLQKREPKERIIKKMAYQLVKIRAETLKLK